MIPEDDDSLTASGALARPAFRASDARLYHVAPDTPSGTVKREKQ